MKRMGFFITLVLCFACLLEGGISEGLLPKLGDVFEVKMPSYIEVAHKLPEKQESLNDGTMLYTFEGVSENEYDAFVDFLNSSGCKLADYSSNDYVVSVSVTKDGAEMSFSYDNNKSELIVAYGKGCKKENLNVYKINMIGETVEFGNYEQDGNASNGKESIEWIVLDVQDGKSLLLSRYCLDVIDYFYNRSYSKTSQWETSQLREWSNNTFIDDAFSKDEQMLIIVTDVDNSEDQFPFWKYTSSGKNTQDKVFALSIAEANHYFVTKDARIATPTKYALSKNPEIKNGAVYWWLRYGTPGNLVYTFVSPDGGIGAGAAENISVRPAMWINTDPMLLEQLFE